MSEKRKETKSVRKFIESILNQFDVIMKMTENQKKEVGEELIKEFIDNLRTEKIDFKKKHIVRIEISADKIEALDEIAVSEPMLTDILPNITTFESNDAFVISANIPNVSLYDVLTYYDDKNEEFVIHFGDMYTYRLKPHFNIDIQNIAKRKIAGRIEVIIPKLPY